MATLWRPDAVSPPSGTTWNPGGYTRDDATPSNSVRHHSHGRNAIAVRFKGSLPMRSRIVSRSRSELPHGKESIKVADGDTDRDTERQTKMRDRYVVCFSYSTLIIYNS
jgi:hypothetical protein